MNRIELLAVAGTWTKVPETRMVNTAITSSMVSQLNSRNSSRPRRPM